jgi:hypothetical protein
MDQGHLIAARLQLFVGYVAKLLAGAGGASQGDALAADEVFDTRVHASNLSLFLLGSS